MTHTPPGTVLSAPDVAGLSLGPVQPGASPSDGTRELVGAWLKPARGRWLRLALRPALPAGSVSLVLRGTPGRWPDASVDLRTEGAVTCGWVFIADAAGGLQLRGCRQILEMLESVSAQLHDVPADESTVPVTMLTAAALYRMGVRGLREVEFREDHCWPLVATGHDPQLRFLQIDSAVRLQVELELATDREACAPVLYWTDRRGGFDSHASRPLHPGCAAKETAAARRFSGGLPPLRSGSRWRLDPRDTPGRFRIDLLHVRTERDAWPPVVQRALDWLLAWRPRHGIGDLVPVKDLHPMRSQPHRYVASTDDPQMRLRSPLAEGWYMLELELELPAARGRAKVYLDGGQGEVEAEALSLPLRSAQVCKRLLWVRSRSRLRLDPTAALGEFTIRHFRVQRVSRAKRIALAGTPVAGVLVWAPCSGDMRMTVSLFSYGGKVTAGFGLHGLRHYFATLLIHNGAAVKTVQLALGHSSPMITLNTYAHEWPDSLDRTRNIVDAAFSPRPPVSAQAVG